MTYQAAIKKLAFERFMMAPFVWLGKLAGLVFPLKTQHNIFLFFPNADIGGAPRVNADITALVKNDQPLVIFSKKPRNNLYRNQYEKSGVKIIDLHPYIDNKVFHFINFFYRGLLSTWINKQANPVVFGGESIFFYKVIPHLRKKIRCVELTHVDIWLPYSIGFIDRINARVFSTRNGMLQAEKQYEENGLPAHYFERLFFIDNAIDIPPVVSNNNQNLEVFFIGRGAPQKRVHLIAGIASEIHARGLPVHFNFVGDVNAVLDISKYPYCTFFGVINDEARMREIYQKADVLLLTSSFEGLPVVVMQMMAYGKVVVSTAVSGIPSYIQHDKNGLLLHATAEAAIVLEGVQAIEKLAYDPMQRAALGEQARKDAIAQFSKENFNRSYRKMLCI